MLGRIDMARTEKDCECCHRQRNEKRDVAQQRTGNFRARRDVRQNCFERRRHRFQLQGDVGDRSDDCDQSDCRGNRLAFSVACGNEICDRGNVLCFGQAHDADQERAAQANHDGRPDINRQEVEAGA